MGVERADEDREGAAAGGAEDGEVGGGRHICNGNSSDLCGGNWMGWEILRFERMKWGFLFD